MPALIKSIKILVSRYIFLIALLIFLILFISREVAINNRKNLFQEIKDIKTISGQVITYPGFNAGKQRVLIHNDYPGFNLMLYLPENILISKGDSLTCSVRLKYVDYQYYLAQNVFAISYVCDGLSINFKASGAQKLINNIRYGIADFCHSNLQEPQASLMLGMLIGSSEDFPDDFDENLNIAGLRHIIAVSGYNVNFLTALLLLLTRWVDRNRLMFLIIPMLIIYLNIVGTENIPALRAIIMNIYILFGHLLGIKINFLNNIGLAMIIVLIINPFAVFSLSLYLSFLAVISQHLLEPVFVRFIKNENLRTSLVCMLGTLPITIIYFNKIYPWVLIINVIAAPLIPIIMELALLTIPIIIIIPVVGKFAIIPLQSMLSLIVDLINLAEKLPFKYFELSNIEIIIFVIFFSALLTIIYLKFKENDT